MAIGTISKPTISGDFTVSNKKSRTRDVVLTSGANYTTGGETITPANVGLRQRIEQVYNTGHARTTSGGAATIPIAVAYQSDGSIKLQQYVAATGAEQSAAANLSTFSVRLTFVGV
jgi:hypothetical protein